LLERAISQRKKPNLMFMVILTIFGALVLFSNPASHVRAFASTSGTYATSPSRSLDVNVTFGQTLRINTPESSNVSILSLSGGEYDTGLYETGIKNALLFTPAEIANYSLVLNVSATGQNSAGLSLLGTPTSTWMKNITGTGNLLLNLTVVVFPQPTAQSSGWNPLFGFTGISLGGVTLSATDVLSIFAIFSVSLILIGIKRSHKLMYAGMFFLSIIGMVIVGILVVGMILGSYLGGFLIIKSYFGFKARRHHDL
jgi:hypothetical protein